MLVKQKTKRWFDVVLEEANIVTDLYLLHLETSN